MNFFSIQAFIPGTPGPQELIVLFLVILLLFGPKRLPEIAKTIGKTLDQLRKGADEFKDQIMKIDSDTTDSDDYSSSYASTESSDYIDADVEMDEDSSGEGITADEDSSEENPIGEEVEDRKDGDDVYG